MPFIVIEGMDGTGKTTQVEMLTKWFQSYGLPVISTREPTDGPIGTMARKLITDSVTGTVLPYLFAADRAQHIDELIQPALDRGEWVVSDRYYFSMMAYQSNAFSEEWLWSLNERFIEPDLTIYLEGSVSVCGARIDKRGERAASESDAFLGALRGRYDRTMDLVERCTDGRVSASRVSASGSPSEVFDRVLRSVWDRFSDLRPVAVVDHL